MEKHGREQVAQTSQIIQPSPTHLTKVRECIKLLQDVIDSPKSLLIVRNAILTLLEIPGEGFSRNKVGQLLRDDNYRDELVGKLKQQTPEYWSNQWDASWRKDKEPLLSTAQQQITKRGTLIEFWTKEWPSIGEDVKGHLTKAL